MKKMKKAAAIILAALMVFAMGSMAFGAETSAADTGSVTIHGLESGVTANAYQIAKATYDSKGNFLGYEMTVSVDGGWSIGSDGSWEDPTEAQLAALYEALGTAAATGTASATSADTEVDGKFMATISDLPVGAYLIIVTGSESVAYGMMIGSVSYSTTEGEWDIDGGEINVADGALWAKATTPTVLKEETGGSLDDYEHGGSANVGDTIEYHITVEGIPSYQGLYPEFYVTDELSTELTITDAELGNLYIMIDGDQTNILDPEKYTVTRTDNGFTVNFVVDGVYTLNEYAGHKLVIDFCADVISAVAEADDHENDVILTYATTSYVSANEGKDTDVDHEYTFAFRANKTDNNNAPLADAVFSLFTDEGCDVPYTQNGAAVTAASGEDGTFTFTGLEEGTYYMKETTAPAGYLLNQAVYKVVITAEYEAQTSKNGGMITSWSIVITDESGNEVASATSSVETGLTVIDTKTGLLPSMGGRGTMIFTIIGCAIVACAVVAVVSTRRRREA